MTEKSSQSSESKTRVVYSGETHIVPFDLSDPGALAALEDELDGIVEDMDPDEGLYVKPIGGGAGEMDAVEVRVLSETKV